MAQPFRYLGREYRPNPNPSPEDLKGMELSRTQYDSLIHAVAAGQDELLAEVEGGAYRVTLTTATVNHMSFTDLPLLDAAGDRARSAAARRDLELAMCYTRAFFDRVLLGRRGTPLDRPEGPKAGATLERFPRSPTRHRPGR
jgi:hypothetical protein